MKITNILKPGHSWVKDGVLPRKGFLNKSDLVIDLSETLFFSGGKVMILRDSETTNIVSYKRLYKKNQVQVNPNNILKLNFFNFN